MPPGLGLADRSVLIGVSSTMQAAAEADRLRRAGVDVVDFSAGEPDFPTPDHIKRAAVRALDENFTKYTAAGGIPELRQAVCDRHAADFGTAYTPAECMVTVGGKQAIFNLVQVLVNPGDEVAIPAPSWVTYRDVVCYAGGTCVFVETSERDGFALTAQAVERRLSEKTKALIINSPSNPSGAVVDPAEFERIHRLTASRGIWLITDECYTRLVYRGEPASAAAFPGARDNVAVAGSVSKTYAMTGWRIGYALAPAPVIAAITRLQSHSTSNATSIAQKAALEALSGPQDCVRAMLEEYRRRRDFVVARLRAIPGVTVVEPQGAFYAFPNIGPLLGRNGIATPAEFARQLLADARVAVVPGEAFGPGPHVRLSYAASMQELERGLERIHRFAAGIRG